MWRLVILLFARRSLESLLKCQNHLLNRDFCFLIVMFRSEEYRIIITIKFKYKTERSRSFEEIKN